MADAAPTIGVPGKRSRRNGALQTEAGASGPDEAAPAPAASEPGPATPVARLDADPVRADTPVGPAPSPAELGPGDWLEMLPHADAAPPEGIEELPPAFVYSGEANDWRPVRGIAVDVRDWGGVEVVVVRPSDPIRVRLGDGRLVELEKQTPVAVPVVADLEGLAAVLRANPDKAFMFWFVPISRRRLEDGRDVIHYRPGWNGEHPLPRAKFVSPTAS